ncbi:MAG: histidine kinase [Paenibacillaceae bacterium]|nr:histidine kinase [Paenibacillaceae bacterium]
MVAKMRELSLKTKLIVFICLFFCIPFLMISINWQQRSSRSIERIAVDYDKLLVGQIQDRLDTYFKDLANVMSPLLVHPLVNQFIYLQPGDKYGMFSVGQQLQREVFPSILFFRSEVASLSLVSSLGPVISSVSELDAAGRYPSIVDKLASDHSFQVLNVSQVNGRPTITAAQRIADRTLIEPQGVLVVDIYLDELTRFFGDMQLGQSGYIWIFGSDGEVIFHTDRGRIGRVLEPEARARFIGEGGYYLQDAKDGKKLVYFSRSALTGWNVVSEVPIRELSGDLLGLRNASALFMLLLVALALLAGGGASLSVTSPLLKLQRLMKRAESGDLNVAAPRNALYVEIDSLNQGFNRMMAELRRLIEVEHRAELREKEMQLQQKESMLRMMQSQINPHFLYNTLEVINSNAIVAKAWPISRMATALARIFRYSVNHAGGQIALRQELEHIRTYLSIHAERNPDFTLHWEVDERKAEHALAVGMILQPIVENAFIHGYDRHKESPDFIAIRGNEEENDYVVSIVDRGGGMDPAVMAKINDAFGRTAIDAEPTRTSGEEGSGGIGIWNVHQRIRLTFGAGYGVRVARSDSSGTTVEIRLPMASRGEPT